MERYVAEERSFELPLPGAPDVEHWVIVDTTRDEPVLIACDERKSYDEQRDFCTVVAVLLNGGNRR